MPSPKPFAVLVLSAFAFAACKPAPVEWRGDARQVAVPQPYASTPAGDSTDSLSVSAIAGDETAAPAGARLVLRADGSPALESVAAVMTSPAAADTAACIGSLRTSALSSTEVYGVWWSRRSGGRASLVAARSDDAGGTWTPPVPVDTTDRGTVACERPAPAIAADATSGYVHVTYFLNGPGGPGVFFSHSMERGELFHAPVPIMYGARPSASAVAAADSVVVVAFEDPNSARSQVALAMSRTWGHIFARERPEASSGETTAERPLVAVRDSVVAVGWHSPDHAVVARVGTMK